MKGGERDERKRKREEQAKKKESSENFFKNSVRFLSTIILKVNECLRKRKTERKIDR